MIQKHFENLGRELRDSVLLVLRDYSEALLLAILMALVLRFFVFSAYKIVNPTMEPNLKLGDFVIGYKLPFGVQVPFSNVHMGHARPKRGEVVVFRCPNDPRLSCIKRVVGLAGDRIELKGKRLIINGERAKYFKREGEALSPQLYTKNRIAKLAEKVDGRTTTIFISDIKDNENFGPYIVPPDQFFAMGDNRDFSEDSRHWGGVPYKSIEAKAWMIWLSIEWIPDRQGGFNSKVRWQRLFHQVE